MTLHEVEVLKYTHARRRGLPTKLPVRQVMETAITTVSPDAPAMSATISLLFGLLVAIVALATLATRLGIPYAILLVVGGLVLGFVPGLPRIMLDPELILVLFLPPLIYSSAWLTSWREFRANLRPILLLAIGLVLVTTIIIAVVAHAIAGFSWPVAFVLGAVVSPTDAVAASATAKLLGLARRVVTVIEGESMVNDATGLVVYRFAIAAVVMGSFSLWQASLQLVVVSLGGLLIGLLISWPVAWLHRHLDDAPIEITITLLTPYAAYLVADAFQVSYESVVKRIIFSDREGHWSQCKIVCRFANPYEKGAFPTVAWGRRCQTADGPAALDRGHDPRQSVPHAQPTSAQVAALHLGGNVSR